MLITTGLVVSYRSIKHGKRSVHAIAKTELNSMTEWPDLYYRRIIRLGRAWAKNNSSSDNPSVYKYGQAD